MTIPSTGKTIALALALVLVAATAASQSTTGSAGGATRSPRTTGSIGTVTAPQASVPSGLPSTTVSPGTTSLLNPALNPPIAPSPADPSPPAVNANAPNLAIQQGGAGSGPLR